VLQIILFVMQIDKCGCFVRIFAYWGNKITFSADTKCKLVIYEKKDGAKVLQRQTPSFAGFNGLKKSQP
jgi:hypothetical protein